MASTAEYAGPHDSAAGNDRSNDPGTPRVPAHQVAISAAALWLCYFALITLRGIVVEMGDFTELLWRRALVTLAGIVVTVLAWPLLRRFDDRSLGIRIGAALAIMLPAALVLAVVNQQAFAPVERRMVERIAQEHQQQQAQQADRQARDADRDAKATAPGATDTSDAADGTVQTTTRTATQTTRESNIRVRHDVAGNVLVDVMDDGAPVPPRAAPVAAPAPPRAPPAPPEPPANRKVMVMVPPLPPGVPRIVRTEENGDVVVRLPGGVVIRHGKNGTEEIRTGRMIIRSDGKTVSRTIVRDDDDPDDIDVDDEALGILPDAASSSDPIVRVPAVRVRVQTNVVPGTGPSATAAPAAAASPAPAATPRPAAAPASRRAAAKDRESAARAPSQPPPAPTATEKVDTKQASAVPATPATPQAAAAMPAPEPVPEPSSSSAAIIAKIQDGGLWRQLTDVALGRYFLLIAWAALYLALGNAEQKRAAEWREGEYRRAAKAAELRSLRYQVNPHFLFNTLNSLSALVMTGRGEQAERMIQTISTFYRHSLAGDPTADVPLADEIALQRHYLDIEAVRFPERLRTEFDVPPPLESACVPGMILQPLVENSIKYAVSATTRPVTIRISAREADGLLVLTVADDGPGAEGKTIGGGTGIGLANVRNRLAARFGDTAYIESGPLPAGGYATVLTIPVIRGDC